MDEQLTDNGGWPIAYVDVDEYNAMCQRAEAAEMLLARRLWRDAGKCPLCSAPKMREIYDVEKNVRFTYCLHCETAALRIER